MKTFKIERPDIAMQMPLRCNIEACLIISVLAF